MVNSLNASNGQDWARLKLEAETQSTGMEGTKLPSHAAASQGLTLAQVVSLGTLISDVIFC